MDELDREILKILCKDARTPFNRIGRILGIGTDTVLRRFKNLQDEGVILGSTVVLSSSGCGIQGLCGLFIKIKSGSNAQSIAEELRKFHDIAEVFRLTGPHDFCVKMFYRDFEEVSELINKLRKIESIIVIDPVIYREKEWSIPFLFNFETEPQVWIQT